jgi:type II secretory pathway component PulF
MKDNFKIKFRIFTRALFVKTRSFALHDESNFFIQNLAVLIGAGIGIPDALASVYEEVRSFRMRSAVREIIKSVDDGFPLSKAINLAGIVAPHTLSLISLGEMSGRLSQNLQVASLQNEKEALFRSRVRSALAYSSFVFVTALVVGIGVAWFVLPKLASFFKDLNAPLPPITKGIIAVGVFLQDYGYVFLPLFFVIFGAMAYFLFSFPKTKFIGHTILFHVPLIKKLILETEVARFGFFSGTMIKAGIPIHTVFGLLPTTTTFGNYGELYSFFARKVLEGSSFQKMFIEYKNLNNLFPLPVRQMIVASEKSGTLSETLLKIGALYEAKVESTSRNIPAFLEPALLLFIGCIVAVLALGILMPVYSLGLYF